MQMKCNDIMKGKMIHLYMITLWMLCIHTIGFAQTKIDTVYVQSLYSTSNTTKDSASYFRVRSFSDTLLMAEDFNMKDSSKVCTAFYKSFEPYVKNGNFIDYDKSITSSEGYYLDDKREGFWKYYYSSGELWYTETYIHGIRNGILEGYFRTGERKRIEKYKDGERTSANCFTKLGKDTTYYEMSIMPQFPGGEKAMFEYYQKNIKYPYQAKRQNIQGMVYVSFNINPDGHVDHVEIVNGRGVHPLLDDEVIRCTANMPVWKPGYKDGDPVKVRRMQGVKFNLSK
jgi:TonB family protein